MKKRDALAKLLLVALCFLSGATSGLGLWLIFDQNTELMGLSVIFAVLATTLLQALIVQFWDWAVTAKTFRRFVAAALFGAITSFGSAGFAAGSYVYAFSKTGVQTVMTKQNASTVAQPLVKFSGEM